MQTLLEQIEALQERADISYAEAKEVLEICNNSVVEALLYLEKQNRIQAKKKDNDALGFLATLKKIITTLVKKGNEYRLVIKKDESMVLNVPVNALVLTTVFALPVTVVGILAALFANHKIRFEKSNGGDVNINETLDKLSTATSAAGDKVVAAINKI